MTKDALYCGVDVGASATKVVIVDGTGALRGQHIARTGAAAAEMAQQCRDAILAEEGREAAAIAVTCATGYARAEVAFADCTRTEISCHARGCLHHFPGPMTIVDIGGQDNKIIKLDQHGKRTGFKLNRKCAAGTGAFLEEIAELLNVGTHEINGLAQQAQSPVKLGSFCTVFTKTEILTNFRRGDRIADLAAGALESVVRRITEMDPLDGEILLTGGVVAHNPAIVGIFERRLSKAVRVPPEPQLTGAIGAALIARDENDQDD
jgi:predicted CoA-substrate-specific enzyme activase